MSVANSDINPSYSDVLVRYTYINYMNSCVSPQIIEYKKEHDMWWG